MSVVEKSIEVAVPVRTAYDKWTQFEQFPEFMEGVERVEQLDDATLRWWVEIAGNDRTFDTRITQQEPDRVVCWAATEGQEQAGEVHFESLGSERTRIAVRMTYDPHRFTEKVGDFLNVIDGRVEGDLRRFKSFIEERGRETGAWRGRIDHGRVESVPDDEAGPAIGSEGDTTEPAGVEGDPNHPPPQSLGDEGPTAGPAERR